MKNNPMQGIKYGLAFVFGALYTSCWWATFSFWNPDTTWLIVPIIGIIFGSIMMVLGIICFFADHWQGKGRYNHPSPNLKELKPLRSIALQPLAIYLKVIIVWANQDKEWRTRCRTHGKTQ